MFFNAFWKTAEVSDRKARRTQTPYGTVDSWIGRTETGAELALLFKMEGARVYSAPGILLSVSEWSQSLGGTEATLRLTPIPQEWRKASVLPFFERAGFSPFLSGRSIEMGSDMPPSVAIEKAAVVSFALDSFSRSHRELLWRARKLAEKRSLGAEILDLLDERQGASRLRRLLGQVGAPNENTAHRDEAIVSALRKIGTKVLVHFDCEGGRLIRSIAEAYPLERAIGVEPSLQRAGHAVHGFELLHGSLVAPPEDLPPDATAILVNSLPPVDDLRRERAAELLLDAIGFDWVLCVDRRPEVQSWAESAAQRFGYRVAHWTIGDDQAVLFRRVSARRARNDVPPRGALEVATRAGKTVELDSVACALESFSKLTVDPRWLFYLPPETPTFQSEKLDGDLEHPELIFDYYRNERIFEVVAELKQMGSRAVAVICRDEEVAKRRFGVSSLGCVYTRRGKPFFEHQTELLISLQEGLSRAGVWAQFDTDWVCLEGEVLPWRIKGKGLIEEHEEVLQSGEAMYEEARTVLRRFDADEGVAASRERLLRYRRLLEQYSTGGGSLSFAPFHFIAIEGRSFFAESRLWHLRTLSAVAQKVGAPFAETPYKSVALDNPSSVSECVDWWSESPGLVIKPLSFTPKGRRGSAQPEFLCRSREHLRLVYGPEYDSPENRLWLSERRELMNRRNKNRRVRKELALSIEAVERFVSGEPLERVEECVRAALALGLD